MVIIKVEPLPYTSSHCHCDKPGCHDLAKMKVYYSSAIAMTRLLCDTHTAEEVKNNG